MQTKIVEKYFKLNTIFGLNLNNLVFTIILSKTKLKLSRVNIKIIARYWLD